MPLAMSGPIEKRGLWVTLRKKLIKNGSAFAICALWLTMRVTLASIEYLRWSGRSSIFAIDANPVKLDLASGEAIWLSVS